MRSTPFQISSSPSSGGTVTEVLSEEQLLEQMGDHLTHFSMGLCVYEDLSKPVLRLLVPIYLDIIFDKDMV